MQEDEQLALGLLQSDGTPALRLYTWSPWAISLGHHQDIREIDSEKCLHDGIDVVRRPTGGRAILHAEELTYCLVMPVEAQGVLQVYNNIGLALLRGLRLFGIETSFERAQPNFPSLYRQASSVPCFSSSARYEIVHRGRKLVGSAQRRYTAHGKTVVLQHGSILCGPAHLRLAEYLAVGGEEKEYIGRELAEKTANLGGITGSPVQADSLVGCIKEGFEEEWGISFHDHSIVTEGRIS
jgi:lipoate-protein ligase A